MKDKHYIEKGERKKIRHPMKQPQISPEEMRVVILLRASSKKQTDQEHDFDIPQQKSILVPFVEQQGWKLVKIFTEGGVSGFKVSASKRDAIQDIKKMADNREFDRLVIYMSDRLGRIADETPLIVSYLNNRGIEVFSYTEGIISCLEHNDKLMTYIKYWQAEGESLKTSFRVSDVIGTMVKNGQFRGGGTAYGYKMVNNGRNNYKGKPVLDLTIDEENEAPVVRIIFKVIREQNFGFRRTAQYLNDKGYRTRSGGLWTATQIRQIVNNPLYKGYYILKEKTGVHAREEIISPYMPQYVIIPEEEWNETHEVISKRSTRQKGIKNSNHGAMLLAGLLFCGYCERKMTSFQAKSKKVTVDGNQERTFIPKYRCSSFMYPQEDACKGQSTYSAKKVEQTVINAVKRYMATLSTQDLTVSYLERIDAQIKALKSELTKRQIAQTRAIKELDTLKAEVIKALMGESKFDSVMLQELLSKKEQEVQATYADVENKERELNGLTENRNSVFELDRRMTNWDSDFESQTIEGQKAMLFQVIDKINLFRDKVEIHINITMDLFKEGLSEQMAEPISPIINEPMAIEGEVLPAESIVAEQSNYGVVNCVSLAV